MVNKSHSWVKGPHTSPGLKVSPDKISTKAAHGAGKSGKTKQFKSNVSFERTKHKDVHTVPGASARFKLPGLPSLTDNRLIRSLTTNWKDIAYVVVGTSLAVAGAAVLFSTPFFWLGVALTVTGALMVVVGASDISRNAEMLRNLGIAEKIFEKNGKAILHLEKLLKKVMNSVRSIGSVVQRNSTRLKEAVMAFRKVKDTVDEVKRNEVVADVKMDEVLVNVNKANEDAASQQKLLDGVNENVNQVTESVNGIIGALESNNNKISEGLRNVQNMLGEEPGEARRQVDEVVAIVEDQRLIIINLAEEKNKLEKQCDALNQVNVLNHAIQNEISHAQSQLLECKEAFEENKKHFAEIDNQLNIMNDCFSDCLEGDEEIEGYLQDLAPVVRELEDTAELIAVNNKEGAEAIQNAIEAAGVDSSKLWKVVGVTLGVGLMTGGMDAALFTMIAAAAYTEGYVPDLGLTKRTMNFISGIPS